MLLAESYNSAFEFVKVIIQNIVNHENDIFDNVTITSALRSDVLNT